MPDNAVLIENDGALYRGFSVDYPQQIWNPDTRAWEDYKGAVPKPQGWGDKISPEEFAQRTAR